ncbi:MAG: hypothetical protein OCD00_07275 [Colwellia sp.]
MNESKFPTFIQCSRILEDLIDSYLRTNDAIERIENRRYPDNREGGKYSGDGGRDFEVFIKNGNEKESSLQIFGETVLPGERYFIEVKYSKNAIGFERTSSNLSRIQNENVKGVFLVTNSYVRTPSYFDILHQYPSLKGDIFIINGEALLYHIKTAKQKWPSEVKIIDPTSKRDFGNVAVTEHIKSSRLDGDDAYLFYLVFYNTSDFPLNLEIFSQADDTWEFTDETNILEKKASLLKLYSDYHTDLFIPKKCSRVLRICGRVASNKTKSNARIAVQLNEDVFNILGDYSPIDVGFQLPFFGKKNTDTKRELKKLLEDLSSGKPQNNPNLYLMLIHGAAGVGKSRLIDEILPERNNSNVLVLHHTINKTSGSKTTKDYYTNIRKQLKSRTTGLLSTDTEFIDGIESDISLLRAILGDFQVSTNLGNWGLLICILEDLHNASPELCEEISEIVETSHNLKLNVVFIFSARDDDSFLNREYRELAGRLSSPSIDIMLDEPKKNNVSELNSPVIISKKITSLKGSEAGELIKVAIDGIQPAGIERILKLSGTVPHHIVQCIEYLLDETLLAIDTRSTLSIIDLYTFEKRSGTLPKGMIELFTKRFKNLTHWKYGESAADAILTATVFGTHFPTDICGYNHGLSIEQRDELKEGLISRRFFSSSDEGGYLQWSHENIELFFQNLRRSYLQRGILDKQPNVINKLFKKNAKNIYSTNSILLKLPVLVQGDIAVINKDYNTATEIFLPLINIAKETNHFVSIDLNTDFYHHIESVINIILDRGYPDENGLFWKLLCLKTYIGAFHLGFRFAHIAYKYANNILKDYVLSEKDKILSNLWLEATYAHIHMDSGFIGAALERFLNLQGSIKLASIEDPDLDFEINNCLRLIYIYTNFNDLAQVHGKLSQKALQRSSSENISNIDLEDDAFMYPFQDRKKYLNIMHKAIKVLTEQGEVRHSRHVKLGLIAKSAPDFSNNKEWLEEHIAKSWAIINDCRMKKYYSILPRTYLLIAVLEYLLACCRQSDNKNNFNHAIHIANLGLNATEAYTIGFISWQLHNLIAVIEARNNRLQQAILHINSAIVKLEKEGLTFIGSGKLISAVPIVYANYLKINKKAGKESHANAFLKSLHGFKNYGWDKESFKEAIFKHANKYHHIITEYEKEPDYHHLDSITKLSVTAWF